MKSRLVSLFSTRLTLLLLYTPAGMLIAWSAHAMHKVEERADPTLPDIAAVHIEPGKAPVILYNPILCKHAGRALCEFYRFHEYGHLALRHHKRNDLSIQQKEQEADRWAATHAPLQVVMAAYRYFSNGGGSSPVHGESHSRAATILRHSEKLALSIGPVDNRRLRQQQLARSF